MLSNLIIEVNWSKIIVNVNILILHLINRNCLGWLSKILYGHGS